MREPGAPAGPGPDPAGRGAVPPAIMAEAAVWIARLHGPHRSSQMECECLAWQARSAAHRLAFERCTDAWQEVAGVTLRDYARVTARATTTATATTPAAAPADGRRAGWWAPGRWAVAASATVTALALAGLLVLQPSWSGDVYETGVGEQRTVVLEDGSRLTLNTATRVRVALGQTQRQVSVEGGEALFEVAKEASRPFVVRAASTEVVATGTAFVVRWGPPDKGGSPALAVTLVEGQVVVRGPVGSALASPVVMAPGERVRLGRNNAVSSGAAREAMQLRQLDRPRMDQLLAWKRGEAIFDNATLLEAVAEMNRYSATPIMADPSLSALRVSGLFKTGDNAGFARAVAALHGLVVREHADRLELLPR